MKVLDIFVFFRFLSANFRHAFGLADVFSSYIRENTLKYRHRYTVVMSHVLFTATYQFHSAELVLKISSCRDADVYVD